MTTETASTNPSGRPGVDFEGLAADTEMVHAAIRVVNTSYIGISTILLNGRKGNYIINAPMVRVLKALADRLEHMQRIGFDIRDVYKEQIDLARTIVESHKTLYMDDMTGITHSTLGGTP